MRLLETLLLEKATDEQIAQALSEDIANKSLSLTKLYSELDTHGLQRLADVIFGISYDNNTQNCFGDNPEFSNVIIQFNSTGNASVAKIKVGKIPSYKKRGIQIYKDKYLEFRADKNGVFHIPLPMAFRLVRTSVAWKKFVPAKFVECGVK